MINNSYCDLVMNGCELAIVIPAYKEEYLSQTLDSLSCQTNMSFHVYVGDDASPADLESICSDYCNKLNISYKRFEENIGKKDLVRHWERCLDMLRDETWVCLFSDDDLMESTCVEMFYKSLEDNPDANVFHYDLEIIDSKNHRIKKCNPWPRTISAYGFFKGLYFDYSIDARMPEFVFRRESLERQGFIGFDLAWRSDNATVMNVAQNSLIVTIPNSNVLWRASDKNISAFQYEAMNLRKNASTVSFLNWAYVFFKGQNVDLPLYHFVHTMVFQLQPVARSYWSYRKEYTYLEKPVNTFMFGVMILYRLARKRVLGDV